MNASVKRLKRVFASLPKKAQGQTKAQIVAEAGKLVAYMKIFAPKDTGKLAQSIRMEDGGPLRVYVKAGGPLTTVQTRKGWFGAGSSYDYAMAQEFGTRKMTAQAFFWPTYRGNKRRVKASIADIAKKAVRGGYEVA